MNTVAIIQFPGSNCEYETQKAAEFYGLASTIVRWNEPLDKVRSFGAYILPGGFSYQDRVRSGAIAAKLPILTAIQEAAEAGKPVLGICNGCQILAESGLVPNLGGVHHTEMALTHNQKSGQPHGFVCDWVQVRPQNSRNSVFTRYMEDDTVFPVPVNHGEGRFVISDAVREALPGLTALFYCSSSGQISADFPETPNGAQEGLAGICNSAGNVMAMMPHPERAAFLKQIPSWIPGPWRDRKAGIVSDTKQEGPWEPLFVSLRDALS
ncbi:MAG: phosphoribosylformylglycinamidine synthase I [Candidatus Margulisiibacteriota bacterium]